jgi:hypothetical protein
MSNFDDAVNAATGAAERAESAYQRACYAYKSMPNWLIKHLDDARMDAEVLRRHCVAARDYYELTRTRTCWDTSSWTALSTNAGGEG